MLDVVAAQLHEDSSNSLQEGGCCLQALNNMKAYLFLRNLQLEDEFAELCQASVWASNGGAPQVAEERVHVLVPYARVPQFLPHVLHIYCKM